MTLSPETRVRLDPEDVMWLGRQTEGPVLLPGDEGYDLETATFNLVHSHRAALVVGAAHRRDVRAAVRFAGRNGLPVAVVATGHGAVVSSDGAVLVNTRRLAGVTIDPHARTARIEAGVRWQQVIDKAAVYGLAPMAGSAPSVGAVAYMLGGGLSPTLVRIAYLGTAEEGEQLVAPLRAAAPPLIDTVAEMPFSAIATIHNDPTEPGAAVDRSMLLRELPAESIDALVDLAGPDVAPDDALMMVEIRHLGGALSREPAVPNAVGNRSAEFNLFMASVVLPVEGDAERIRAIEQRVLDRFRPWGTGGAYLNFMSTEDVTPDRVRAAYDAGSFDRLLRAKQIYDPHNTFRINHNIRPPA